MNVFYKKSKLCTGKNDLLCPNYAQKEKLDYNLNVCPKCNSELTEIQEINKGLIITLSVVVLLVVAFTVYKLISSNKEVQTNVQVTQVNIDPIKLINEYVGSVEIDTMKYVALYLKIKDVITDNNGNYSFNYDLNTKDYRDKGVGRIFPMYNKISFNSTKLNYFFNGDYKYENNKIIIIGDNKKWQLNSK